MHLIFELLKSPLEGSKPHLISFQTPYGVKPSLSREWTLSKFGALFLSVEAPFPCMGAFITNLGPLS
jgi:hypothetical protein